MGESPRETPEGPAASRWLALGPVLIAAAVYSALTAFPDFWNVFIWPQGLAVRGYPFLDMEGHLAASRAFADGILVPGEPVPGDPWNRIHAGPTWMLWLGFFGLGPNHALLFTGFCVAAFLATVAVILRPQSRAESACLLAALLGPPVVLLVERGNIDLFVFVWMAAAAALLAAKGPYLRWTGWAVIAAFIGFKYFPALGFAGITQTNGSVREKISGLVLGLFAVVAFVVWNLPELSYVAGHQVENRFFPFFGARELLVMAGVGHVLATPLGAVAWIVVAVGLARLAGPLDPVELKYDSLKIGFLCGGAIVCFCFLATSSPDYRLIFLLPCVPWLWTLRRRNAERSPLPIRRLAGSVLLLFIVVPWWGTLLARLALAAESETLWWIAAVTKQLGWWMLTCSLGALLVRLLAASWSNSIGRRPG